MIDSVHIANRVCFLDYKNKGFQTCLVPRIFANVQNVFCRWYMLTNSCFTNYFDSWLIFCYLVYQFTRETEMLCHYLALDAVGNRIRVVKRSWTVSPFGWIQSIVPRNIFNWSSIFVRVELEWRAWVRITAYCRCEKQYRWIFFLPRHSVILGLFDESFFYKVSRFLALDRL